MTVWMLRADPRGEPRSLAPEQGWAPPKDASVSLDWQKARTGDDMREFVNPQFFSYLHGFREPTSGPDRTECEVGQILGEIKNKIQSGYNLGEIIDYVDALRFRSQADARELSHLYEAKIRHMGNAGRNGGEYCTPRPLIPAMVSAAEEVGRKLRLAELRVIGCRSSRLIALLRV